MICPKKIFIVIMLSGITASKSLAAIKEPEIITIPAGPYIAGSSENEREMAYRLDEDAYDHQRTREWGWYENERDRRAEVTGVYGISRNLVTNNEYAEFIRDTGYPWPDVGQKTWDGYGLIHPYERTRKFAWASDTPPQGRGDHPVVLVSIADARAYARWLSSKTERNWRLPSEEEWEKAARGTDGRAFPWGDQFDASLLNSHDTGPFDTMPVGAFPRGASPFGMLDAAGQVFEWTASSYTEGRYVVKGGSWDDKGCGVCRPGARHARPESLKHILIGFRLVTDTP